MADYFADQRHALYVGWVLGIALKNGIEAEPEVDGDGNYTDRIVIKLPRYRSAGGRKPAGSLRWTLTLVVPPPPEDWTLSVDGDL